MDELSRELVYRWHQLFCALAAGDDVPPAQRLRAEGLMEAAVLAGVASADELQRAMDAQYLLAFGSSLSDDFGSDWSDFYPFPQIPGMAQRAPVWPSTPPDG